MFILSPVIMKGRLLGCHVLSECVFVAKSC
jgi:hypothetical protein